MTVRIQAHGDGEPVDITEGVQVLYDALCSSMDWGSGFLDTEEVAAVRRVSAACGFADIPYPGDVCLCGHSERSHGAWYVNRKIERPSACWELNTVGVGQRPPPVCECPGFRLR